MKWPEKNWTDREIGLRSEKMERLETEKKCIFEINNLIVDNGEEHKSCFLFQVSIYASRRMNQ